MRQNDHILEILERIKKSPLKKDSHLYPTYGEISIGKAVELWEENYNGDDFKPAIIFLRVVLAANRKYTIHVKPNIDRIISEHPEINSFSSLKIFMNDMPRESFYKFWGHKNLKKYNVLINLLEAVDQLREKYEIKDDFELMKEWAKNVDLKNYKSDIIGKIENIAIATIQHLRMDFGIDTVKPDQRVIEVLKREFDYKKVSQIKAIKLVEEIANITGIPARKIDLIFVNYGSGYYDNRQYYLRKKTIEKIARKLRQLKVPEEIIYEATGIKKIK